MSDAIFPAYTQRLELRFHGADDAADLLRVYSQQSVAQYHLEERWDEEYTQEQLAKRILHTTLEAAPHALALVVADASGRYVADIALWLTDVEHRQAEIAWVSDPQCDGLGYLSEAAGELLKLALGPLQIHRVAAQLDARDVASAALAQELGFRKEGLLRENLFSQGEFTDTVIYAMLVTDLPEDAPTETSAELSAEASDEVSDELG